MQEREMHDLRKTVLTMPTYTYICKDTKLRVYQSLVLSILLYNSETWTLRELDKRRLLVFKMTVLVRIAAIPAETDGGT
jgi:hypothetical protein